VESQHNTKNTGIKCTYITKVEYTHYAMAACMQNGQYTITSFPIQKLTSAWPFPGSFLCDYFSAKRMVFLAWWTVGHGSV